MLTKKYVPYVLAVLMIALGGGYLWLGREAPSKVDINTGQAVTSPSVTPSKNAIINVLPTAIRSSTEIGAWVWKNPVDISTDTWNQWMAFCNKEGIRTIYLDIGTYTDIKDMHDTSAQQQRLDAFTTQLRLLVAIASQRGIKVQGLAGYNTWANPASYYIPEELVTFVTQYNQESQPESRLSGMQFDIEPYQQSTFEVAGNRPEILKNYLRLLDRLISQMQNQAPNLAFGVTVPYWLDGESDRAQALFWNGKTQVPVYHVFDTLAEYPHAYAVILDYRDTAEGKNGSIQHATDELNYARSNTPNLKILIGQETSFTKPSSISFYGHSASEFKKALAALSNAFASNPTFGGFAIHHLESYFNMQ